MVGISDLQVSNDPKATLVTYALGSCIAVTLYDPVKQVGGLLHFLLPSAQEDSPKQTESPLKYCDTGLEILLKKVCARGGVKRRLIVKVVGGAQLTESSGPMDIGRCNYEAVSVQLTKHGLSIRAEDVGGRGSRTAMLELDTGKVTIRGGKKIISN